MKTLLALLVFSGAIFANSDLDREIIQSRDFFKRAISNPKLRDGDNIIFSNIDSKGKDEVIIWQGCNSKRGVDFFRLVVLDSSANIAWSSRCDIKKSDPFSFYSSDKSFALPAVIADIDGDGKKEIIVEVNRGFGDSIFRIFRWQDKRLKFIKEAYLVQGKEGQFLWTKSKKSYNAWLSNLSDYGKKGVKATLNYKVNHKKLKQREIFVKFQIPQDIKNGKRKKEK